MSNDEVLVAEQVVSTGGVGPLTVRISQHSAEDFWRVDVSRNPDSGTGHRSATVAPGDSFMMNLIESAVGGEAVAWSHLAAWGCAGGSGRSPR